MQRPPLTHIPAVLNGTPPHHPVEGIGGSDAELGEEATADGDENEAERLNPTNDDQPGENSTTSGHGGCPVPEPPPKAVTPPKPRKRRRREANLDTYAEADLLRKQIAKAKAEGRFGSFPPKVQPSYPPEKINVVTPSREKMARLSVAQEPSLDPDDNMLIRTEMIDSYFKTQKELRSKMEKEASEALSHPPSSTPLHPPVDLPPPRSRGRPRKRPIQPEPKTPIATNGEERVEDELDGEGGHKHTKALREKGSTTTYLPSIHPLGEETERASRAWASELDILARLPPIDPSTLEDFKNFDGFWRSPELQGEGKISIYNPNVQHPTVPLEDKNALLGTFNVLELNPGAIPFTPVPTSNFSTTVVRKRPPRVKKEKVKSLIDWGDSDSDEEEENDEEVEELLQPEFLSIPLEPTPVPFETYVEDKNLQLVESISITSSWKSAPDVPSLMEVDKEEEEEEEEKVIVEVPPEAVDRLHGENVEGLNGNYDKDGVFREWHEMVRVCEELHIFPYTVIDF